MTMWNILATAKLRQERSLLRLLSHYGEFKGSGFRDVVLGRVGDVEAFLKALEALRQENPGKLNNLSQIVPLEKTFQFEVSDFMDKAKEAIPTLVERLENKKFHVRVKRRGHKGEISSQAVERELADFVFDLLEKGGKKAQVSFADPDAVIILETIGNWAGIGLVIKEMKEECPLVRLE